MTPSASKECPAKGKILSEGEIAAGLVAHRKWLDGSRQEGDPKRLNLCGAYLVGAKLSGADLSLANLSGAKLSGADLSLTNLSGAVLLGVDLDGANLQKAKLISANLSSSNLHGVTTPTNLHGAKLTRANLNGAKLNQAILFDANLSGSDLSGTDLTGATLSYAHLTCARPGDPTPSDADLTCVSLDNATLSDAELLHANVTGAQMTSITLAEAGKAVDVQKWFSAVGLSSVQFSNRDSPKFLQLREEFKKLGYRKEERDVNAALRRSVLPDLPLLERYFNLVFFDATSEYGASPGRPLWILVSLIVFLTPFYALALRTNSQSTRRTGWIWRVWSPDRILDRDLPENPERVTIAGFRGKLLWGSYFSILSASHFGWRDLNVGTWIARIQSREYALRATGWVRSVSGIQSLISVYLIALWALTYFGRPFEG